MWTYCVAKFSSVGIVYIYIMYMLLYMQSVMTMVMLHHMAIGQLVTPILVCSLLHGRKGETNWTIVSFTPSIEVTVSGEQFPMNGPCDPMDVGTCVPQFETTAVGK